MLNEKATELSRKAIPAQLEYLKQSYPFLRMIHETDSSYNGKTAVCAKMDYYNCVDCYAVDLEGRFYTIQLKSRESGNNDLIYIARKVTDEDMIKNPHFGFTFKGKKYSFILNSIDIFCEMINGKVYNVRATDLMSLEFDTGGEDNPFIKNVCIQEYFNSEGNKFRSGNYYVFISIEKMMEVKERLMKAENWDYYEHTYKQEE